MAPGVPLLHKAYDAKVTITDAYDAPNRHEAERAILKSIQAIPGEVDRAFGEMTTAFDNWKTPILNDFENPATNAFTESVDSSIAAPSATEVRPSRLATVFWLMP